MRLKQWLTHPLMPWGAALGATVMFSLLESMDGEVFGGGKYFFSVGFFLLGMLQIYIYQNILPLSVSFGSTRKEALTGLRLYRILSTLLCTVTAVVFTLLEGEAAMLPPLTMLPFSFGLYLLGSSLGGIMGKAFVKWGNNVAFAVFFGISICGAMILCMAMIFMDGFSAFFQSFPWQYAVLALGIAAHLLMLPLDKKLVYGYTVKL